MLSRKKLKMPSGVVTPSMLLHVVGSHVPDNPAVGPVGGEYAIMRMAFLEMVGLSPGIFWSHHCVFPLLPPEDSEATVRKMVECGELELREGRLHPGPNYPVEMTECIKGIREKANA
jgi:hypothetical protein